MYAIYCLVWNYVKPVLGLSEHMVLFSKNDYDIAVYDT